MAVALVSIAMLAACTSAPTTPAPAAKSAAPAGSPVAASPSPLAQATPTPQLPRAVVGGGAAQPRAGVTQQPIGGNAIVIVPTPNFASNPTPVPAPLAPAVAITTVQPAAVVQVVGTLSRIPTAIPSGSGGGGGAAAAGAAAAAVVAGGGGTGIQTIPAVVTATPPVRINPQPQPTIAWPGR